MKKKIREIFDSFWDELTHRLRMICGKPSPIKRFTAILIIGVTFSIVYTCTLVKSIYNIGKNDARKEFLELEHIKQLELIHSDNIYSNEKNKNKEQEYEYEYEEYCE
jgi:hypothetical protein